MDKPSKQTQHRLLLLLWLTVGAGLRFAQLEAKPPWSDEWATIVYSLGHTFATVPLDRIISLDALLQPLQLDSMQGTGAVIHYLMRDSTHPPFYFVLSHWWIKLLSPQEGLLSIGIVRSLSALLGVAAIPAMFGVGCLGFRSYPVGQIAAALMAVSPYGIYLAQEARHYTLAILWAIASLGCLIVTVRHIRAKTPPPVWVILIWVGVNSLGMATHYFFSLALAAEFLVLMSVWLVDKRFSAGWIRIYGAVVGTLAGVFVWFPALRQISGNELTDWIYEGDPLKEFLSPIGQLCAWIVTMPFMLPVEGTPLPLTVLSGLAIMIFLIWLLPSVVRSLPLSLSVQVLGEYAIASIALVLGVTYLFGADLTVAARFQFNYFPAILLLLGAGLASLWQKVESPPSAFGKGFRARGKTAVIVALMMGLLGGLTVVSNFGYQKFERPDLLIPVMIEAQIRTEPILIATTYQSYGQTVEMMGLAWQFRALLNEQNNQVSSPQFLLAEQDPPQHATQVLQQAVRQTPLQLWLVNFSAPIQLPPQCATDSQFEGKVPGYRYRLYRCRSSVEGRGENFEFPDNQFLNPESPSVIYS